MARAFVYDGREYPDPDPNMPVEKVRQTMASLMPELANAETKTDKRENDDLFIFEKRVGTKG